MRYLAWFALPFCGALLMGCLLPFWWLTFLFMLLFGVLAWLLYHTSLGRRTAFALLAAGACLGCGWFGLHHVVVVAPAGAWEGRSSGICGEVVSYPEQTDYGISLDLRITSGLAKGRRVQVFLDDWYHYLKPGDQLTGTAEFSPVLEDPEGTGTRYASGGVFLQADVELASAYSSPSVPLRYLPAWLGEQLKQTVARLYEGQQAALLQGLLTGDKSGLTDFLYTCFRRAGLAHLLAVSGLHVGFLTGMVYLLPGRKKFRIFLAVPLMVCFALMTGGQSSVWRAVVMGSLLLAAPLFGRETDPITSLSAALMVLLLPNPYAILNVGLQLSFAAVAGLACFGGKMYHWMTKPLKRKNRRKKISTVRRILYGVWRWVAAGLATSCCATVFTLPLSAWYFGTISLIGPLANLFAVWAASLAFGLGLVSCGVVLVCPALGEALAGLVGVLLNWLMAVARILGNLTFAAVTLDNLYLRLWLVFLLAAVLLTAFVAGLRRRPLLPLGTTAALLMLALSLRMLSISAMPLCVSVLDVGEGSCTVFSSRGCYVAVDCGGYQAGDVLADYLQSGGVSRLALLTVTHYDTDHVNGVEELLERIQVDTLLLPDVEDNTGTRQELEQLAQAHGCHVSWVSGDTVTVGFGAATLTVYPPVDSGEDNTSCVSALCTWQDRAVLVTGDLEQEQERMLLERENLPELDVLVVGHHGSNTSTGAKLLAELSPDIAVISVGSNSYGLPAQEVLERLADYRCKLFRTDENGTVTIRCR